MFQMRVADLTADAIQKTYNTQWERGTACNVICKHYVAASELCFMFAFATDETSLCVLTSCLRFAFESSPPVFSVSVHFPRILKKILFPPTFENFPRFSYKLRVFTYFMSISFPHLL